MKHPICPRCDGQKSIKSGIVRGRQRFRCKKCGYYYTVNKLGKKINNYHVVKALQLYLEGLSYREIERILGISHVSVMNWVKKYRIKRPDNYEYHPTYRILTHRELVEFMAEKDSLDDRSLLITPIGDKFMVILWVRYQG
jgi:transposase-like protein